MSSRKLNHKDWGLRMNYGEYKPVISRLPCAPEELAKSVKWQ